MGILTHCLYTTRLNTQTRKMHFNLFANSFVTKKNKWLIHVSKWSVTVVVWLWSYLASVKYTEDLLCMGYIMLTAGCFDSLLSTAVSLMFACFIYLWSMKQSYDIHRVMTYHMHLHRLISFPKRLNGTHHYILHIAHWHNVYVADQHQLQAMENPLYFLYLLSTWHSALSR